MRTRRADRKTLIMKRRVQRTKVKELESSLELLKAQAVQINNDIEQCEATLAAEKAKLDLLEREN